MNNKLFNDSILNVMTEKKQKYSIKKIPVRRIVSFS